MPRPPKCRRIGYLPDVTYFKPQGIPMRRLEEVQLSLEEAEALRLKDIEGMDQEEAAGKMNISRPIFQRILVAARQKVSDALLNGKAIRIAGGNFKVAFHKYQCHRGHKWDIQSEEITDENTVLCPTCNSPGNERRLPAGSGVRGRGRGNRRK